jgi:methyl-accepting chemotaxis protein
MSQVDQVTQRNASAAEELASTAEEMASQAEALQQLVSYFRVSGAEAAAPRALTALRQPRTAPAPSRGRADGLPVNGHPSVFAFHEASRDEHDFQRF